MTRPETRTCRVFKRKKSRDGKSSFESFDHTATGFKCKERYLQGLRQRRLENNNNNTDFNIGRKG